MMGRPRMSDERKLADLLNQLRTGYEVTSAGCWEWRGLLWENGYGRVRRYRLLPGTHHRAHVFSYMQHVGEVSPKKFVCHTCDNKQCINPAHLFLGTNQDNQLDAVAKGVFSKVWTPEKRKAWGARMVGSGNPMFGVSGENAPCWGRTGEKHPMYMKHHSDIAKAKISASLKAFHQRRGPSGSGNNP